VPSTVGVGIKLQAFFSGKKPRYPTAGEPHYSVCVFDRLDIGLGSTSYKKQFSKAATKRKLVTATGPVASNVTAASNGPVTANGPATSNEPVTLNGKTLASDDPDASRPDKANKSAENQAQATPKHPDVAFDLKNAIAPLYKEDSFKFEGDILERWAQHILCAHLYIQSSRNTAEANTAEKVLAEAAEAAKTTEAIPPFELRNELKKDASYEPDDPIPVSAILSAFHKVSKACEGDQEMLAAKLNSMFTEVTVRIQATSSPR